MNTPRIETDRLILRKFTLNDIEAIYKIFGNVEINRFLPFRVLKNLHDAQKFFEQKYIPLYAKDKAYGYAICLQEDNYPIGFINIEANEPYELGYGLRKEFWHQGIVTEAAQVIIKQAQKDKLPYITATHDRNNPRSGGVMKNIGMTYQYSYEEQWQPKDILVTFRMYQLNLDSKQDRVCKIYWNNSTKHFIEKF